MIITALLVTILLFMVMLALTGRARVPWASTMRRVHPGEPGRAEWMASESVIGRVEVDYIEAMNWLRDTAFAPPDVAVAARYLTEAALEQYERGAAAYEPSQPLIGVLRVSHKLHVRRFDESGERCVVVDLQGERLAATYASKTGRRVATQNLGGATVVYEMVYDLTGERWKVACFVQQLPPRWSGEGCHWLRLQVDPLERVGRDS